MEYDLNDFKRIVEHHRDRIGKAYHKALQKLNAYPPELRAEWTPLALAVLMHVHTCHCMRLEFAGVPGATPRQKKGRAFILELDGAPIGIADIVELKCKRVDQRLLTRNIPTEAVKAFHKQRPERRPAIQESLGGWIAPKTVSAREPAHGNAGYMLDALGTGFERLCVTYLTGLHSAELVLEIPIQGTDAQAEVVNLTVAEITEAAPRRRVKRRKAQESAEEAEAQPKVAKKGRRGNGANS